MREKEPVTTIILLRHGNTDFPDDRIYCDMVDDPELNQKGIEQVKCAGSYLQGESFDAVYVSPSKRTIQTASIALQTDESRFIITEDLKERNFGVLEGLYFKEIEEQYSEEYKKWKTDPIGFTPKGGESVYAFLKRIQNAVGKIIRDNKGKRVLAVCHVGSIRMSVVDAIHIPVESYRSIGIDNASFTRIDYGSMQNNLIYLNRIAFNKNAYVKPV